MECSLCLVMLTLLVEEVFSQGFTTPPVPAYPGAGSFCGPDQFFCGSYMDSGYFRHECIPDTYKCDGAKDCSQPGLVGNDELVSVCTCEADEISCGDRCLPKTFRCDRVHDCPDNQDEIGCDYACKPGTFYCGTNCTTTANTTCDHKCVPTSQVCNGIRDCYSGTDEDKALCTNTTETPTCPRGHFRCTNGKCVLSGLVCNDDDDCGDSTDETLCDINECDDSSKNNCSGVCVNLNIGYKCLCADGYKLMPDNTCEDIDECSARPFKCSQFCVNTEGSYNCTCDTGYVLDPLRKTCGSGTPGGLFFIGDQYVGIIEYDYEDQYYFFVSMLKGDITRVRTNRSDQQTIIGEGIASVEDLAVDWINKKLYWTDSGGPGIYVAETNGSHVRALRIAEGERPRALVVHPRRGMLYWTDWSLNAFIAQMGMDGSNMSKVIQEGLYWPTGLTIDYAIERFWWADGHLGVIETSDLKGGDRYVVLRDVTNLYDLDIFVDVMLWSDPTNRKIYRANRFTGAGRRVVITTNYEPHSVTAISPLRQPGLDGNLTSPCADGNGNCSHLCLLAPGLEVGRPSYSCLCPQDFILEDDGRTCRANCSAAQFECGRTDHRCIPRRWRCDGRKDCKKGEDEQNCRVRRRCPPRMFQCRTSTSSRDCVDFVELCDGTRDCRDGSDEDRSTCTSRVCLASEMRCPKGRCIPRDWVCDGDDDCHDGSDEGTECKIAKPCTAAELLCANGKCVNKAWRCDNVDDCGDGTDEPRRECLQEGCREGERRCRGSYRCVANTVFCNGVDDCHDGSDEDPLVCKMCNSTQFKCQNDKCIPKRWACDFQDDCGDQSDEDSDMCKDIFAQCKEGEYLCDNNKCLAMRLRCNHDDDCGDNSDEKNCTTHECPDMFQCDSGHCILASFECDGKADCRDVTDESGCPPRYPDGRYCATDKFACNNTVCLEPSLVCDGDDDCGDKSDENDTLCAHAPAAACPNDTIGLLEFGCDNGLCVPEWRLCDGADDCGDGSDENNFTICEPPPLCKDTQFLCTNLRCLPKSYVCDKVDDCGDNSDEHGCNVPKRGSCDLDNGGCERNCTQKGNRYLCSCPDGFRIDPVDKKTCLDEDECAKWGNYCPQVCVNTKGSFECSCASGFQAEFHGKVHLCKTTQGPPSSVLIAAGNNIRQYREASREYTDAVMTTGKIRALDVDGANGIVYWTDVKDKAVYRAKVPFNDSSVAFPYSLDISGIKSPEGVAFDWATGNVYLTDSSDGRVLVAMGDGRYLSELIGPSARRPTAIAVSPKHGLMLWVDPKNKKIESAWMDGSNVTAVVTKSLYAPVGVAIDHYLDGRFYWVDHKRKTLESANLDGSSRFVVALKNLDAPFALDVFESNLYWLSSAKGTLRQMDKFGRGINVTIVTGLELPQDVKLIHRQKQPKANNRCQYKDCSHLCVLIPNGSTCVCPVGSQLKNGSDSTCDAELLTARQAPQLCWCFNGGTCVRKPGLQAPCACKEGFTGKHCEIKPTTTTSTTTTTTVTPTTTTTPSTTPAAAQTSHRQGAPSLVPVILPLVVIIIVLIIVIIVIIVYQRRAGARHRGKWTGEANGKWSGASGEERTGGLPGEMELQYNANTDEVQFSNPMYDQVNTPATKEAMVAQEYVTNRKDMP